MLALWSSLVERNEYPPPSRAATLPGGEEVGFLLERIVARVVPDLPDPLPRNLFDPGSARAMARVVHAALGRLHPGSASGRALLPAMAGVPTPRGAAAHVTQAALGWFALPIARRLESEAFRSANRGEKDAEGREAAGEALVDFLSRRPLLSLRADTEDFFSRSRPPALDGLEESGGLRRWLIHRLASPGGDPARRAAVVAVVEKTWERPSAALREVLLLRTAPADDAFLAPFVPLLARGDWPEDLAPALRERALALRSEPPKEDDAGDP